ncbi:hypothetical protein VTP01DRAFT_1840, partial [Rhizomucor pusillus]|uniref:uncharacterized protein n=1 Tax=Rhizomucor pusillus TaxID=4840 RepID=UPI0037425BC1
MDRRTRLPSSLPCRIILDKSCSTSGINIFVDSIIFPYRLTATDPTSKKCAVWSLVNSRITLRGITHSINYAEAISLLTD